MVRDDGVVVTVDTKDVQKYLLLGYRPQAADEGVAASKLAVEKERFSGPGQGVKAAIEGGLAGATLGGSDLVLDALGADTAKRADHFGKTRIASEIIGAVLTAVPTGGGSLAGRGVAGTVKAFTPSGALATGAFKAGERIAGKGLGGKVVGGAIEGGVAGVAFEASRASLADDPLTVENAVAGATLGAFFGGGAMGLAHGAGKLATGVATRRSGNAAMDALSGLDDVGGGVDDFLARQGSTVSLEDDLRRTLGKAGAGFDGGLDDAMRTMPDVTLDPPPVKAYDGSAGKRIHDDIARGIVPDDEFVRVGAAVTDVRNALGKLVDESDAAHKAMYEAIPRGKPPYGAKGADKGHLTKNDPGHLTPPDKGHLTSPDSEVAGVKRASDEVLNQVTLGGDKSQRELAGLVKRGRKAVDDAVRKGDSEGLEKALAVYKKATKMLADATGASVVFPPGAATLAKSMKEMAELGIAVRGLRDLPTDAASFFSMAPAKADEAFAAISKMLSSKVPEAAPIQKSLESALERLTDAAGVRVERDAADVVSRLRATYAVGREAASAAEASYYKKSAKETADSMRGPDRFDNPWDPHRGPKNEPWVKQETTLGKKWTPPEPDEFATSNPSVKSPKADNARGVASRVGEGALRVAANKAMGGSVTYAVGSTLVGILMAGKAKASGVITKAVEGLGKTVEKAGKYATKVYPMATSLNGLPDAEYDLRKSFERRSTEIRDLFANGKDRAFLTAQDLSAQGHPEFALAAYTASTRALDVLMRKLPKDPPGTRWGTESIWQAPEEQMVIFSQEYAAATQPAEFLAQALANPTDVFPSAIEVLEEAWPAVYNDFRSQVLIKLSEIGTQNMRHAQLVGLGILLNATLSPHMAPENIQDSLAMFAQPPPAPASPQIMPPTPGANDEATGPQRQAMR